MKNTANHGLRCFPASTLSFVAAAVVVLILIVLVGLVVLVVLVLLVLAVFLIITIVHNILRYIIIFLQKKKTLEKISGRGYDIHAGKPLVCP